MSGPVDREDVEADPPAAPPVLDVLDSGEAQVGRFRVRRALPRRTRRTVGAWCFADHMGPADVEPDRGLDIGAHPHTGLATVTWLVDGEVLHRDSLGTEQVIAPGQLNLMTAGAGVSHAEEATGRYAGRLEGVQLWVAQPDATRAAAPAFEHHAALPQRGLTGAVATVLVGDLDGTTSPARADTPLLGVDLDVHGGGTSLPLDPHFEHAVVVLQGAVRLDGRVVEPGRLAYLGTGRDELGLEAGERTRLLLLGGEPFPEPVLMWWNFVGRSREELEQAHASWSAQDDRFGRVASGLPRTAAPRPFWRR